MIKKRVKQVTFILILLIHSAFIGLIFFENQNNVALIISLLIILVLLGVTYVKNPVRPQHNEFDELNTIVYVFLGAISTYFLHSSLGLSTVLSASIVGLTVSFVPSVFKQYAAVKSLPVAMYCGTFVGMTSTAVASGYLFIILASCITGVLLVSANGVFHNIGGKLGTLAFGGVVLAFLITLLISL
ncbi:MAG: hypothetical protein KBT58_04395 [Bizionia sp.]|nr:hypothetical protein [Bizionia sp.]